MRRWVQQEIRSEYYENKVEVTICKMCLLYVHTDLPPIVEKLGLRLQSVVTTPEELAVPNFEVSFDVSRVDRSSGDIILAPGFTFTAAPAATAPGCTGAAPAI